MINTGTTGKISVWTLYYHNIKLIMKLIFKSSMDEISLYDLPALFDFISKETGQQGNIIFIGHSLGPTLGMIYAAALPERALKTIKMFIYMAPAYTLSNMISPMRAVVPFLPAMLVDRFITKIS